MRHLLATAEGELLLHLARSCDNPATDAAIEQALRRQPDWDRLLELTHWHGISPLVWRNLSRFPAGLIPAPVRAQFEVWFQHAWACHDILTRELLRILDRFGGRGLRAIAFKGPVLVACLYSGIPLRVSTDLDILIAPDEFPTAMEVLGELGYAPQPNRSAQEAAEYMREAPEMPFVHATGVTVDLHLQLGPSWLRAPFDHGFLWPRAIPVPLGAASALSLNDDDLLLYLCYHGGKSLWSGLKWLCDIDRLVSAGRVNWSEVESRAVAHGCWRSVSLGLLLASATLGSPVPQPIVERASADRTVRYLAGCAAHQWLSVGSDSGPWRRILPRLLVDGAAGRLLALAGLLSTPTADDLKWIALPSRLSFLYYFLRPFRVAWKYTAGRARAGSLPAQSRPPARQAVEIAAESVVVRSGRFNSSRAGSALMVMNLADGQSLVLDETAALLWELLAVPTRASTLCGKIRGKWAEEDTLTFLRRLAERRAIKVSAT
jgi:hypothetical protein